MRRFNLLLVNADAGMEQRVLKSLSRVYRQNFVFAVQDFGEAQELLHKLRIDLMVVDLDHGKKNLVR